MAYGTLLTDAVQSSTANTPPQFNDGNGTQVGTLCRAWVNFNGTGTVAIRASFNVSSITDNGTGDYRVNLVNAMPDANYSCVASCNEFNNSFNGGQRAANTYMVSSSIAGVACTYQNGGPADPVNVSVAIFR